MKRRIAKLISVVSLVAMLSSVGVYQIALAAVQKQWPSTASPSDIVISNNGPNEDNQHVTRASDGDFIFTFLLNGRPYAYKISATDGSAVAAWNGGFPTIASTNIGAPIAVVADNSGGAYVALNIDQGGGNCDVIVQRLDSTGTVQYGGGGVNITTGSGCEAFMQMIPDGSGGIYLAWGNGGAGISTFQSTDLYITRMDSNGTVNASWNTGGAGTWRPVQFPESQGGGTNDHSAHIVADGLGNIVAIYESSIPSFYFAATKFDANGNIAGAPWNTPLQIDADNNGNLGRHLVSDGSGNVYIGFLAGSFGSPDNIQVQKLNSSGAAQWGTGVTVTSTDVNSYSGQPRIAHDGSGGVIVAWQTAGLLNEVYGHHVTSAGVLDSANDWASAPISLSASGGFNSSFTTLDRNTVLSDGAGGAYVLYGSFEGGSYAVSKLQHIGSDGSLEFPGDGTTLGTGAGIEGVESVMISDGSTGVVVAFQDETGSGMDVYAQRFDEVGGGGGGGSSATADAEQEIICGALTLNVDANNDFRLDDLSVSNTAQDSFGDLTGAAFGVTYQDGTNTLPEEAFIYVDDSRTVGATAGCATNGSDEGWTLSAQATNFSDGGSNSINADNFHIVTTTDVTPDTGYAAGFTEFAGTGDGSDTNVFYTTGYSDTQDVVAQYNLADTADLTTAAPFTTEAATLDSSRVILDNATGAGTNDFKFTAVGTGIAYYLNIPEDQAGGVYASTVTLTLAAAT